MLGALTLPLAGPPPAGATTTSITTSLHSASGSGRGKPTFSFRPWISGDGRFVAFDSDSANLVPGDTNRVRDIFIYDRDNGTLERVSQGAGGTQANGDSQRPTLSGDGRYVAFWSAADNLVEGDGNGVTDCFVHDRQTYETLRVSVGANGVEANGECARPVLSGDGRLVAFESAATNLERPGVLGKSSDSNKARDVFVYDLEAKTTTRMSVTTDGKQGTGESVRPALSADGRFLAFQSDAALQSDDTNDKTDVYMRDLEQQETIRISVGPGAVEGNGGSFSPSLSEDGRFVAYWSNATGLVSNDTNKAGDVFVFDRTDGSTVRISVGAEDTEGDGMSSDPSISPDGRYVTFWSAASNLVPDDTNEKRDIFLVDRETSGIRRVSVADDGTQADGDSFSPNVGGGGGLVAFDSAAKTLVPDDRKTKGSDIYLHWEDAPPGTDSPSGDQAAADGDTPSSAEGSPSPQGSSPENPSPPGEKPSDGSSSGDTAAPDGSSSGDTAAPDGSSSGDTAAPDGSSSGDPSSAEDPSAPEGGAPPQEDAPSGG